ncbi:MAG: hypothetical protein L3J70_08145 [Gammaproteobacteria bacterium]|nr:hypothetical protein [Gammaproteobacteria bacterium]
MLINKHRPKVGQWYSIPGIDEFEVTALGENCDFIDIQYYDGMTDKLDQESWGSLELNTMPTPQDWSQLIDEIKSPPPEIIEEFIREEEDFAIMDTVE